MTEKWIEGVSDAGVIVTGAAGGIGRAVAEAFARAEARVVLWDAGERVHAAAEEIQAHGAATVRAVRVDVTDRVAVSEAFDSSEAAAGSVSVVVHAAGTLAMGPALRTAADTWERCLTTNATGTMHVASEAARRMVPRGRGAITVITSNAASTPRVGMSAYGASKAAAAAFVRGLGLEVAGHGVRCNLVSPGSTDTEMLRRSWTGTADIDSTISGDPAAYRLGIPLRRVAQPQDIADAALFLSSAAARHITLHDLRVDGGATLDM
ncbi:SDR family oxidoreductase [Streptomyces sp. DSM 118148]|uniref:SDR family oxidoreductase n=1 Tax=Streptomyces sp. DSM 118148 TaxID=3448667 RepID=UPI00403FCD4C